MMDSKFLRSIGFSTNSSTNALQEIGCLLPGATDDDICIDTVLRLNTIGSSLPHLPISKDMKRKWSCINGNTNQHTKTPLDFGGGYCSSSLSESKSFAATANSASSGDLDLQFSLQLGRKYSCSSMKVPAKIDPPRKMVEVDLELSLSTWPSKSDISSFHGLSTLMQIDTEEPLEVIGTQFHDQSSLSLARTDTKDSDLLFKPVPASTDSVSFGLVISRSTTAVPKSSITCTSKHCKFTGCSKGARGASGLCISHGGGRRCQRPGCEKGAEGKTSFCKAHGGGKRCQFMGCIKSAEGHTDFCIAHGGGRRCGHEGCTKASRGKSGLCIRHGGGKRCKRENCTKSAEGILGLCISHGGGRRCQYPACTKGSQGSTMFCKAHGGGKRCTIVGCTKGAEGRTLLCKSHGGGKRCSFLDCRKCVHGGTSYCVAHGGGKRCASFGCSKSARGRTDFCVKHGGGKRCIFQSCDKSAQGSTDFCKAHGSGGKRCSCGSLVRSKTTVCSIHDKRIHGGITLGPLLQVPTGIQTELKENGNEDYVRSQFGEAKMAEWSGFDMKQNCLASASSVPEGRVHGGGLLAMLTGGSG